MERVYFFIRALLKLLKFEGANSCLWKLLFLASRTFPPDFSDTPSSERYFLSSRNVFLNESSNPYGGGVIFVLWKPFSFIYNLSTSGIASETSGNPFFWGKDFITASRKGCSV